MLKHASKIIEPPKRRTRVSRMVLRRLLATPPNDDSHFHFLNRYAPDFSRRAIRRGVGRIQEGETDLSSRCHYLGWLLKRWQDFERCKAREEWHRTSCSPTVDGRKPAPVYGLSVYPIIFRVSTIQGGAGFLPSTVAILSQAATL